MYYNEVWQAVLIEQEPSHSRVAPSDRDDSPRANTGEKGLDIVPATVEINLAIDPVAYRYESWSEMADGWVESLRSTATTMPDSDHDQIRNVTPLVPLPEVEALVEQLVVSGEVTLPHEPTDTAEDTSSL